LNQKAALNRMLFAVCISLCFWSFGFAMSISAPDATTALLWRRDAAIGYATLYANILVFLLIMTGRGKLLRKWWLSLLLYAPALLNILIFCVLNTTVAYEYNIVRVAYGWTNITVPTIWDILFYVYYAGYIVACLAIAWLWKKNSSDKKVTRQAKLIIASFLIALVLGTVTDVVMSTIHQPLLPQMAPVIILIPVSVFFYCIKRYGLMHSETNDSNQDILSNQTRTQLLDYLSGIYMFAGIGSFFFVFFFAGDSLFRAILIAGALILIGLIIYLIQHIRSETLKYSLNLTIILLSIPAVTFLFINYGSVTSWVFPVIFILVALVFNRRSMLVGVSAVALLTQVFLWMFSIIEPTPLLTIEYIVRICFFAVVTLLGMRINRIYIKKLKENAYQISLQKLVSEISYNFARADKSALDANIDLLLRGTGDFFSADRAHVVLIDSDHDTLSMHYEWCRSGFRSEMDRLGPVPVKEYERLLSHMSDHRTIYHDDIKQAPASILDGFNNSSLTIDKNITSILSTPIEISDTMYGFLGYVSVNVPMKLQKNSLDIISTFANLIAGKLKMIKDDNRIENLAYFDQLTSLPNRLLFNDRARQAVHLAQRQSKHIGLIFMDLDSFKAINDTMGHSGGDEIIREVAKALSSRIRKTDTVARFGGDEFMILLNDIPDFGSIPKIADSIMSLFERPFELNGQEYFISASAGVAVFPYDGEDIETLLKNADIAMYRAKAQGANQYVLCTPELKEEVHHSLILTNSLYRALERGEFLLHYQPQIQIESGKVIGLEALLRWKHPSLGMIPPSVFIPLAEKNGLIGSIGEWVLRTACTQNKAWQDQGLPRLRMAVNLSIIQFRNPKLVNTIESVLSESGLSPEDLELEITESAAINETGFIVNTLRDLKRLGVSISIDDFGTEYSSLKRLRDLPIDRIKIDMQFIQGLEGSEKNQAITMIIINLAKNLGLRVIAEGVETKPQLQFLQTKDCDEVQGYYFYKPMPPEAIEKILDTSAAVGI
jgi:diguanylate cyclase (GGDEF)-like protein